MIRHCALILWMSLTLWTSGIGQLGGKKVFEFLSLPTSARTTGLAGQVLGVMDDDISLALQNPASLNPLMHNRLSVAHNFHFADIQNGSVSYGRKISKPDLTVHAAVQYIHYGNFQYADEFGVLDGTTFSAAETAFTLGASKKIADRIFLGANLKGVFGRLENYSASGMASDIGLNYITDSSRMVISFLVRNVGTELTTYHDIRTGLPLDIQIGLTKKLKYLPFRFSIIAHQLHRGNIRYDDPNKAPETDLFGEEIPQNKWSAAIDNVFRHLLFNGEFLLGRNQNFRLRGGYNHLRRRELSLSSFRSLAGFSLGVGVKASIFRLDYGLAYHHLVGATNHITISTDLSKLGKKG